MTSPHEIFVEGKYFPAGCSKTWRLTGRERVPDVLADAERLARHIQRRHCIVAGVFVVDHDNLFEEHRSSYNWPDGVKLLVASPNELAKRDAQR